MTFRTIDPAGLEWRQIYRLLVGSIVPRPIAWVSSISREGQANLAPFSYFMAITDEPPTIAFSCSPRAGQRKDTLRNVEATGQFVVNVVVDDIAEAMNKTAAEYPAEVNEFQVAGLTPVPSDIVRPPRVAESPVNMECRLNQVVPIGEGSRQHGLVIGEIVLMHLRGTPQTMRQLPPVRDIVPAVRRGLAGSVRRALRAGIRKSRIVLDPGIGFGKTGGQSFELLNGLRRFASLGYPILVGPSRKSFLRAMTSGAATVSERAVSERQESHSVPEELLFGTAAAVTAAILNGAHIVRVHDVREMLSVVRIADRLLA